MREWVGRHMVARAVRRLRSAAGSTVRRVPALHAWLRPAQLRMVCRLGPQNAARPPQPPEGYAISPFRPGQEAAWLGVLRAANEFRYLDEAALRTDVIPFLVPDGTCLAWCNGVAVGVASCCALAAHLPSAVLMYVAVAPEHRGRGLGKAVTAATMESAVRAGFGTMLLHTDDRRLAAIATYLSLGFEPDTSASCDAPRRWMRIRRTLDRVARRRAPTRARP